ncbi:pyridoxal-phosphate dependent enzyme [Pseudomonas sp. MH10]|uniref:pyridoxal-phosphate dependent enzyme n=2 Tax=Pseudomonas sp. MH10 TaxID=3048627 RepID=UPI003A0FD35F
MSYVAQEMKRKCTVYVPVNASELKLRRLINGNACVEAAGKDLYESSEIAKRQARKVGGIFISPFSHPDVIKGQGTLGMEMLEEAAVAFENLIIPFGGGGLLAGVGAVFRTHSPDTKIIAVHPEAFNRNFKDGLSAALRKGVYPTVADGLAVQHGVEDAELLQFVSPLIDSDRAVSEKEIECAIVALLHNEGILAEGAGAISLAPLISDLGGSDIQGNTLVIISGGNISTSSVMKCLATHECNSNSAKLLGHQSVKRVAEMEREYIVSEGSLVVASDREAECVEVSIWFGLSRKLVARLDALLRDIKRHKEYAIGEGLDVDLETVDYVFRRTSEVITELNKVDSTTHDLDRMRSVYRLKLQEFGFLRNSLAWCSASNDQSGRVMFFDPQENNEGSLNYDRYGSMLLREVEIDLLLSLGFDTGSQDLLLVSSGQAAYTVIESFLLGNVLVPGASIVTSPYIYFEALEQLERLKHIELTRSKTWDLDSLIDLVNAKDATVIFLDALANLGEMNVLDLSGLARKLEAQSWGDKWLVIDGTMVSGGVDVFALFCAENHPTVLYYESGSKYLQFGMDLQMAGVVVAPKSHIAKLAVSRRNTGSVMYQSAVTKLPDYDRKIFLIRMKLLSKNAAFFVEAISNEQNLIARLDIAYPSDWYALGWQHGGGVVAISMKDGGFNNRACLEGFIGLLLQRCRERKVEITKGVSFGFSTIRVSAAAAMADNMPPFLRFSMGEENSVQMLAITQVTIEVLHEFFDKFDRCEK